MNKQLLTQVRSVQIFEFTALTHVAIGAPENKKQTHEKQVMGTLLRTKIRQVFYQHLELEVENVAEKVTRCLKEANNIVRQARKKIVL